MPSRLINLIAKHADAERASNDARDASSLKRRFVKLLRKLSPRKNREMLDPVEGVSFLTEWEKGFGERGAIIFLDEMAEHVLKELGMIDRRARAELRATQEIGSEALRKIPPINLKNLKKTLAELEAD